MHVVTSKQTKLGAKRLEGTSWKANTPRPPARRAGGVSAIFHYVPGGGPLYSILLFKLAKRGGGGYPQALSEVVTL